MKRVFWLATNLFLGLVTIDFIINWPLIEGPAMKKTTLMGLNIERIVDSNGGFESVIIAIGSRMVIMYISIIVILMMATHCFKHFGSTRDSFEVS